MGLTLLSFLVFPAFLANILIVRRRFRGAEGLRITEGVSLSFAIYALLQSLSLAFISAAAMPHLSHNLIKTSAFFFGLSYILIFVFVLDFPVPLPRAVRIVGGILATAAAALALWRIVFTPDYILATVRAGSDIVRVDGPQYGLINNLETGLAALSAAILLARSLGIKSRIQRQRGLVAFAGVVVGAGFIWLLPQLVVSRSVVRSVFALTPVAALVLASVVTYAFYLSRIFDWRSIGRQLAYYALLTLVVGLPTGFVVYVLTLLRIVSETVPLVGTFLVFFVSLYLARGFSARFLARSGAPGEYREELESGLAHIDLAEGRDLVLGKLYKLLSAALDFSDFTVLIEDDQGSLKSVFSPQGSKALIEKGSDLAVALDRSGATVLLKSEALAHPAYEDVRAEFMSLFESLNAEAFILAREGRHIIGAFILGARRTGADFTDYDYDTFKSIYGKLFVFAYYLKNVARESLLYTVDREIALSDQIIRFALEKVDTFRHPKVDAAWALRYMRTLGGDFIDFVRLSPDRWFFVMGDVSGKGLSASMNMLILKSMIRTFLRVEKDFVSLVSRINSFIKENLPRGNFFAGIFGYFDLAKDAFYYINCGIPALLLYSPSFDAFIEVQGEGKILGFVRDIKPYLKPRKLVLPPGCVLVAATDGITDSENLRGERFGKERLRRSIQDRLGQASNEIVGGVLDDLLSFSDRKQDDDLTLFVIKFPPRSAE
ncbi:MAG TPA: PP2C family protein-serine/threonine phosphatase [Rectinemataceae bacterium]|nr:PP2C family protein-serine/threonine phosphatase [Rectinemataceae bacterium]